MIKFPSNFFWGSATSSYQVEGNNSNVDWWAWEKEAGKEASGEACRHYECYAEDFDLVKGLNHKMHRLSIEWARIEPREGEFSSLEIQHYVDVIKALRARGIEPMVTLHHFTNPCWFSQSGGWSDKRSVARFMRYVEVMATALAAQVHYWITINEPTVYISHSFMWGVWPPQLKSNLKARAVHDNLNEAHIKAYGLINRIYQAQGRVKPAISISQHMQAIVPCGNNFRNRVAAALRDKVFNFEILDTLMGHKTLDFIGVNYYSRNMVDVSSWWIGNLFMENCKHGHDPRQKNSLGWDIYPEGLYQILIKLKRYGLPVMITENGICTADDAQRWDFIKSHLTQVNRAMQEGANVTGYLYWSLLDNFEWDKGYAPRFGLIQVDYSTQQRQVRGSALKYAQVCKTGVLE